MLTTNAYALGPVTPIINYLRFVDPQFSTQIETTYQLYWLKRVLIAHHNHAQHPFN
jgi:hypothetical protein